MTTIIMLAIALLVGVAVFGIVAVVGAALFLGDETTTS